MCYTDQYMTQAKRQLSMDMAWEDGTKKLRTSAEYKLVTCLEDLSNEMIYEIFDYLAAHEIFDQFSNLNRRFENLILHSNLPLKVHDGSPSSKQSAELLSLPMIRHRILSLHLSDHSKLMEFFPIHIFNFSFDRLHALTLHELKFKEIMPFLPKLTMLPRLFSLKISLNGILDDHSEIYRFIFRLPTLKYLKLSADQLVFQDSISAIAHEQSCSIEHLVIDHPCTVRMIYDILFCTPNIRRLSCKKLFHLDGNSFPEIPLGLFHLTQCAIRMFNVRFDVLEGFLMNLSSQLRVLSVTPDKDAMYLNADRWERLISRHMPHLHTLQYRYSDVFDDRLKHRPHHAFIHRFTSPFWIEKGWMLNIQTDVTYCPPIELIYSIQPHKKFCCNERKNMDVSKAITQLTVRGCHFQRCDQWFIEYIRFIAVLATITSLHIEIHDFSIDILVQILQVFPNLDALTLVFKASTGIVSLTQDQIELIHTASKMNQIAKVNVEQSFLLCHLDILINLCPQMECLQVQCRQYSDMELMLRVILMRRKLALSSLHLTTANADEWMVTNLRTLIDLEKLLAHYTIQRAGDRITVHWETLVFTSM